MSEDPSPYTTIEPAPQPLMFCPHCCLERKFIGRTCMFCGHKIKARQLLKIIKELKRENEILTAERDGTMKSVFVFGKKYIVNTERGGSK